MELILIPATIGVLYGLCLELEAIKRDLKRTKRC
jgi:hypothetical protein